MQEVAFLLTNVEKVCLYTANNRFAHIMAGITQNVMRLLLFSLITTGM